MESPRLSETMISHIKNLLTKINLNMNRNKHNNANWIIEDDISAFSEIITSINKKELIKLTKELVPESDVTTHQSNPETLDESCNHDKIIIVTPSDVVCFLANIYRMQFCELDFFAETGIKRDAIEISDDENGSNDNNSGNEEDTSSLSSSSSPSITSDLLDEEYTKEVEERKKKRNIDSSLEEFLNRKKLKYFKDEKDDKKDIYIENEGDIKKMFHPESLKQALSQNNGKLPQYSFTGILYKLGIWNVKKYENANIILFPITGPETPADIYETVLKGGVDGMGLHWSLLCYFKETNKLYHYDTCNNMNHKTAYYTALYLKAFRVVPENCGYEQPTFVPQQKNGWECGYLLLSLIYIMVIKHPCRPLSKVDVFNRFNSLLNSDKHQILDITKKIIVKLLLIPNRNLCI
jgi:hypothetical protein